MKHTFLKQGLPSKIKRATPLSAIELKHLEAQYLASVAEAIIGDIRPTDGWLVNVSSHAHKKRRWRRQPPPTPPTKPWAGHFGGWP